MTFSYRHTRYSCYIGYITQAIINNLLPLLFIIFNTDYGMSYTRLGSLILVNFVTQLIVDVLAARFADNLGYRGLLVAAHLCAAAGLAMLSFMPNIMPSPYAGLVISVIVYGLGGGLLEVLVSPVVDSLPAPEESKAAGMALLHSFYCWGQVFVVLLTTLLLRAMGLIRWQILPVIWALIPLSNIILLLRVPFMPTLPAESRQPIHSLFASPVFLLMLLLMVCSGASELTISQWSSLFAERGLGVAKVWGDLAGPCLFAILMGIGRTIYGVWGSRIRLTRVMILSSGLCVLCYLVAALAAAPVISLVACALCGLCVSLMWPGVFSLASPRFPAGGAAMFAILAMCGDLGCSLGPSLAGAVADRSAAGLNAGILSGGVFPLIMFAGLICLAFFNKKGTPNV